MQKRLTHLTFLNLGSKRITDFDGNEAEYYGDLDQEDCACGWGFSTYTTKHGVVEYKGTFLNDKFEGAGVLTD